MKRTRQRNAALLATATATVLLTTVGAGPAVAAPETAAGNHQAITWAPCTEDPTAECGTLTLPVDWADPGGPKFGMAVARRKATAPRARIGSLVINPGGPGSSGVDALLGAAEYFSADLRRQFDLVGFDPRGVARSHPVTCARDLVANPPPLPDDQAGFDAMIAYNQKIFEDCRERTGPLFDHVDTLSVVRDLDALREAVGDRTLTYYGISYGTLIGQQYAELFGDRVRTLALDSNVDHSLGTAAFLKTETVAAEDSFDEFAAWCDRTEACVLHERGVRGVYAGIRARAERGELQVTAPGGEVVTVDPFMLAEEAIGYFYRPEWPQLAEALAWLDALGPAGGSATPPPAAASARAPVGTMTRRLSAPVADAPPATIEYPVPVLCQDWHLPVRDYREYAGYLRHLTSIAPDFGPSPIGLSVVMGCLGWSAPVDNPQHPLRVRNSPPLLLTNSLHDPATTWQWAKNAARQLGRRGVLVPYEGWGHGVYGRSECTTEFIDDYLLSRKLPDSGTRCPAVEPPLPEPGMDAMVRSAPAPASPHQASLWWKLARLSQARHSARPRVSSPVARGAPEPLLGCERDCRASPDM